jgi:hypothetical protein
MLALFSCVTLTTVSNSLAADTADASRWTTSKDCTIALRDGQFVITSTGGDPFIVSEDIPAATGPFKIELRVKSKSQGPVQFFWSTQKSKGNFNASRHVDFSFLRDDEWHDYALTLDAPDLGRLRLDPSTAPGETRVAFIRVKDKADKLVKEWKLGAGGPPKELPNSKGNAQIRAKFKNSDIVITTTARLAGAIHSLTWNGREFIDSADHGRQLQSATNLDCGTPLTGETYNPTEAGSMDDGAGPFSTSKLLSISAVGAELKTTIQMAFWLSPGEKSGGNPAKNKTLLSEHRVSKRVHIGHGAMPNVIEYDVTLPLPNEHHTEWVIEALTGYMPPDFKVFQTFDPATGTLAPIGDGPGEQPLPLVFSTEDKQHAMGIFAPDNQPRGNEKASYGRFRFVIEKVVKWNCVYRIRDKDGIKPGEYSYKMFVIVGTLEDVRGAMKAVAEESGEGKKN